jgi:hypothetical protein
MKPEPPPEIPGKTPWERLDNAVRRVFSVPKEAIAREEKKMKRSRLKKSVKRVRRKVAA